MRVPSKVTMARKKVLNSGGRVIPNKETTCPSFTNMPPHSSSARRSRSASGALPALGPLPSSWPDESPSDGPRPYFTAMRVIWA